jgi:hypothetical protein
MAVFVETLTRSNRAFRVEKLVTRDVLPMERRIMQGLNPEKFDIGAYMERYTLELVLSSLVAITAPVEPVLKEIDGGGHEIDIDATLAKVDEKKLWVPVTYEQLIIEGGELELMTILEDREDWDDVFSVVEQVNGKKGKSNPFRAKQRMRSA